MYIFLANHTFQAAVAGLKQPGSMTGFGNAIFLYSLHVTKYGRITHRIDVVGPCPSRPVVARTGAKTNQRPKYTVCTWKYERFRQSEQMSTARVCCWPEEPARHPRLKRGQRKNLRGTANTWVRLNDSIVMECWNVILQICDENVWLKYVSPKFFRGCGGNTWTTQLTNCSNGLPLPSPHNPMEIRYPTICSTFRIGPGWMSHSNSPQRNMMSWRTTRCPHLRPPPKQAEKMFERLHLFHHLNQGHREQRSAGFQTNRLNSCQTVFAVNV